jgi:hypothetical protein
MLMALATCDPRTMSWRFLRVAVTVALALTGVALAVRWGDHPMPDGQFGLSIPDGLTWASVVAGGAALMLVPTSERRPRAFRWTSGFGGAAGLTAVCLLAVEAADPRVRSGVNCTSIVLGQLLGTWLLGSITVAWLLGHAYLTATRMTIAPLRHFSRLLSWSVWSRIVYVPISLAAAWLGRPPEGPSVLLLVEDYWLIVFLRVGVGLVAVAVFAYMVSDCVRLRSTQSATGILYFASVFAYMGQLAGQYMIVELGWTL